MSRVLTFSRTFPSYHPRKGEPTYFVEKILKSLEPESRNWDTPYAQLLKLGISLYAGDIGIEPKHHTIRAGHRFKAGDWFSPRVWGNDINPKSGRRGPYHSKQIIIGPDIQVKKTWDFDIHGTDFYLNGKLECALTGEGFDKSLVAMNDGLTLSDFTDWFCESPDFKKKKQFIGQIICHNENIEY